MSQPSPYPLQQTRQEVPPYRETGPQSGNRHEPEFPKKNDLSFSEAEALQKGTYSRFGFGGISRDHSYTAEATLESALCPIFRFGGILSKDAARWRLVNKQWCALIDSWVLASATEPSLVMRYQPEQKAINQDMASRQLLLAFRCDLTPGVFIRALGTQVTGEHRVLNMKKIEHILRQVLSPRHFSNYFVCSTPDHWTALSPMTNQRT